VNRLIVKLATIATLVFGLAACGPEYDRTEISAIRQPGTFTGELSTRRFDVPEGLLITAHIAIWNDDNEQMSIDLRSKDPSVVEINQTVNDRNYTFIGKRVGSTEIQFVADGEVVLTIPATVSKQPELP
jgi:hypothetical protein